MRIVKEFNLGPIKCSLMFHNEKYTLKMEDEGGEVNYKLGNPASFDIESLPSLLTLPDINSQIAQAFIHMRKGQDQLMSILQDAPDELYDEIF